MGRTGTEFVKTRSEQELNRSEIVKRKQHVRSEYPVLQFTDLQVYMCWVFKSPYTLLYGQHVGKEKHTI